MALTLLAFFEGLTLFWFLVSHEVDWKRQAEAGVALILDGLRPNESTE